ncbi:hypothetical protein H0E87_021086 [Populus deltoides]|uniref:Uncharacterized protein n=1 Tax=Populus deltoides TaxID=3696 RepID=A0A8T2XNH5_POPDE|nr:hypothetical protein H0E87_021086 [Populus deltoides]
MASHYDSKALNFLQLRTLSKQNVNLGPVVGALPFNLSWQTYPSIDGPLGSYNTSYQIPAHTSINMGSTTLPQRTARFLHSPPGSCGTTPNSTTKIQDSLEG